MDVLSRPALRADHRIPYGPGRWQFGDLWLPETNGQGRCPVVAFFHGGWWKSAYDLGYAGYLCAALKRAGIATWSMEYRRVGETGGGWPNTFEDAADGFDFLRVLATGYPLDLSRVITMGHSAGGHLAFWVAGRERIPRNSAVYRADRLGLRGSIALAGAVDLRLAIELSGDGMFAHVRDNVYALMGGTPVEWPSRYAAGDPGALLPLEGRQILIQGTRDDQIPADLPVRFAGEARLRGSEIAVTMIRDADHLDVVDPDSDAWSIVLAQVTMLLRM